MSLRDTVFGCWIARFPLFGTDLALAGHSALELRFNFTAASLLQRICAGPKDQNAADHQKDRQGLHLLILGMN